MATERYSKKYDIPHEMSKEGDFWTYNTSPEPATYTHTFTANGGNGNVNFTQNKGEDAWVQIDNVSITQTETFDDEYDLFIREYPDAESTNGQLFNEVSQFPNDIGELLVPINEYLTHTSFNEVLGKMRENYEYLLQKSKFLSIPPNALQFRYGSVVPEIGYQENLKIWVQDSNNMYRYWDYNTNLVGAKNVTATSTRMIYNYDDDGIETLVASTIDTEDYNPRTSNESLEDSRDFYVFGEDRFTDIIGLGVLSEDRIILLDKIELVNPITETTNIVGQFGIFTHDDNWKFEDIWKADAKVEDPARTFFNPRDMKVHNGRVYVSCDDGNENLKIPTIKILNEIFK